MSDDFQTFEEFWPFYVREHSVKLNRVLHFVGTGGALSSLALAVLRRKASLLLLAPVIGYGAAWVGHFVVQKNRPATFKHPLWSLRADFVMFSKILAGTMDEEVERVLGDQDQPSHERANGKNGSNGEGFHTQYASSAETATPSDPHSIN